MAMDTALDFIKLALSDIDVIGVGETPSAEEAADGLVKLNLMLDSWELDRPWIYQRVRFPHTLTANVASYTIGLGAAINTPRPSFPFERAGLILDTTAATPIEVPITVMDDDDWARIGQKTLTSTYIRGVYHDFSFASATGYGLVYVWPIPTLSNTQAVLYLPGVGLAQFANLTTTYLFPKGVKFALWKNLIVQLARTHGRPITRDMVVEAEEAKGKVEAVNARTPLLRNDALAAMPTGGRGTFDIRTGDWH
jgi:hypothetical protein